MIHAFRQAVRRAARTLAVGIGIAPFAFAAYAAGEKLTVEISLANLVPVSESRLKATLGDSPLTILRRGAVTLVETDAAGYKMLLADDGLASVKLAGTSAAIADSRAVAGTATIELTINLKTARPANGAPLEAAAARLASRTGRIVSSRRTRGNVAVQPAFGPDMLLVRGLNSAGQEISRSVIADPRLVRYEAAAADGSLSGRRDFIRDDANALVALPDDPRMTALSVSAFDDAGGPQIIRLPGR